MGFLRNKILQVSSIVIAILLSGCAKSLIQVVMNDDKNTITMFGKTNAREFYVPVNISDSLKFIWKNDAHGSFTNSSVVYKDSIIFVSDLGGRIHCFDLVTGKQIGMLRSKGTVYSTPLIINYKLIYALCDDKDDETELIFYDMNNGKELFISEIDGRVLTQMLIEEGDVILCTENGTVQKISSTGKNIWQLDTKSKLYCNPAMVDGKVLIGNDIGEIIAVNSRTGVQIYREKIASPLFSGITIDQNQAYVADNAGVIYSLKVDDGEVNWSYDTKSRILMNPAVDAENIYIGNLKGELFSINKISGKINWKSDLGGLLNSTPLITDNRIIITNLNRYFSIINKENGLVTKKIQLEGRGKLSPVLIDNKLIMGYDDGMIRAYEFVY
jgi:outer membrane protein assembly factor BamB